MLSIDEINDILSEIAGELPEEIFSELNGGINLLPDTMKHEADPDGGLYTLGQYRRDGLGRYIVIYYGSICAVCEGYTERDLRKRLKKLLCHELTHHLESLAGERDLELEDEKNIEDYLKEKRY